MKKVIIIIAICLIIIAGGVLTGLYIIGDKIIDETIEMSIPTLSEEATAVADEGVAINSSSATTQQDPTATAANNEVSTATVTSNNNSSASTGNNSVKTKQPAISVKKMNEIKEEVTAQDKVSAAAMVMSRLSTAEVNQLKSMLSGGLTAEEKAKAKSIAFANFSSEEIKEIKNMYTKYMNDMK